MTHESCQKCRKSMAKANRWFQCTQCSAFFCPSCMDRFCLLCKGKVDQVPVGGKPEGGLAAWLKSLFG